MDKTGIIVVSLCAVLLVFWLYEQQKQEKLREQQHPQIVATNGASATTTASTAPGAALTAFTSPFDTNIPEKTIVLTNARARYTFTSRGGGLELIELIGYTNYPSLRWKTANAGVTNSIASLNAGAPVPVLSILGDTNLTGNGSFDLAQTDDGVRAEKLLPDGLRLVKEFHLSSNYLVNATVELENTTGKPLAVPEQQWVVGTAMPMDVDDNGFASFYGGAMWFDGKDAVNRSVSYFNTNTRTFFGLFSRTPTPDFRAGSGNVVWAAAQNQFFTLLAMPANPAPEIFARPVALPPPPANLPVPSVGVLTALVYPAVTLSANSNLERQIIFYAGPKEFRTLAKIGDDFQNRADLAMNFGSGYMSFWGVGTFFAKLLLSAMNWLHDVTNVGYGWAIVIITVILRLAFWPFTAMSIRSSKKMQALAPEIKALKEKYKDDPQKFTQKQMELWKKNKVNPMSGCLPMLVQMPVFFGFYSMLRSAIELRGAHFLWVADLTKPDTLFMIPGIDFPFNLLPLLMVAVMVWQAHLQPPSPGMDPSQQKMMRYMPLIFLLFLYSYSSGMALYMTVSTLLSGVQAKLTRTILAPATSPLTPPQKTKK